MKVANQTKDKIPINLHAYLKQPSWDREIINEERMFSKGKEAAEKNFKHLNDCECGSLTPGVRKLNENTLFLLAQKEFVKLLNLYTHNKTGPRPQWYRLLECLDLGTIVWIALKTTEDLLITTPLDKEVTRQDLAIKIGAEIENDLFLTFAKNKTEDWKGILRREKPNWRSIYRAEWKKKQKQWMKEWKEDSSAWTVDDKALCGLVLLESLKNASIIRYVDSKYTRKSDRNPILVVELTPEVEEAFLKSNKQIADNSPKHLPMVYSPDKWVSVHSGGYLINDLHTTLVKSHYPEQLKGITPNAMPEVFRAVNGIQNTPWRINRFLLYVMLRFWRNGKHELFFSKKRNYYRRSALHQMNSYLKTAGLFSNEERFWLPANLDYRGRLYYIPSLNPQGPDCVRALLEFADGRDLWLNAEPHYTPSTCKHSGFMLYGENLFGLTEEWNEDYFNKEIMENAEAEEYAALVLYAAKYHQRRDLWVKKNEQNILDCAENPFQNQWWMNAKKPWMFLRWCIEYRDCKIAGKPILSHMPVYTDMTCNGFQHLCALVRDEKAAVAVNLASDLVPHDLYRDLAEQVKRKVEILSDSKWANNWLKIGISRKLIKPVVMSMPYGSQPLSHADGLQDYLENLPEDKQQFAESEFTEASWWMANIIRKTVEDQKFPAIDLLDDLKVVAKQVSKSGKHLTWTSPAGFPVRQLCYKNESREIKTMAGAVLRMRINTNTQKTDPDEAQNQIAANLIHSLDAATLHKTVCYCLDRKITSLAVIHDSFATWSFSLESLDTAIRECFIKIHSNNLLPMLWNHFASQGKQPLSNLPVQGKLDLSQVITSTYMSF